MNKKNHPIEIVPYNHEWPKIFISEANQLKPVFASNLIEINHIGSTSVPGLAAKPTIDISIAVKNIELVDICNDTMEKLEYEARGEHKLPGRRFFVKGEFKRLFNVHVFEMDNPHRIIELLFCEYLRNNPDIAQKYAEFKCELALKFATDREQYIHHKKTFINPIKTMLWDLYNKK